MTVLPSVDDWGELNSIPLETYAWRTITGGYDELLNTPALRGEDLVMPGAAGRRPYPRILDATTVSIPMLLTGEFDEDGNPTTNPRAALLFHRDYLRANLGLAADGDPDDGTVPFVLHRNDLADWSGPVTFLGIHGFTKLGDRNAMMRLDLSIPDGELADTGS